MKVLFCLCLLIAAASASHWLTKREVIHEGNGGPDCSDHNQCLRLYKPISNILKKPSFNLLVDDEDGHLNLNCSALSETSGCDDNLQVCLRSFSPGQLFAAWKHFCENKQEVEALNDCWNGIDVPSAISMCFPYSQGADIGSTLPRCVGNVVEQSPECGESGGRLIRELLSKLWAAHMAEMENQQF